MNNKIPQYLFKIADYNYNLANIKRAKLSFLDKTIIKFFKGCKIDLFAGGKRRQR